MNRFIFLPNLGTILKEKLWITKFFFFGYIETVQAVKTKIYFIIRFNFLDSIISFKWSIILLKENFLKKKNTFQFSSGKFQKEKYRYLF